MDDPLDTLQRQVDRLSREVADYKRQAEHEATMRSLLQERLERLERSLHGKIGRAEAISILALQAQTPKNLRLAITDSLLNTYKDPG
jgi:predicted  nucleic acid-binding Zn-ribbon protein